MQCALQAVGINKKYGALVVNKDVNLDIIAGEVHAVMGENGAGKSTLMGMLFGLVKPTGGTIKLKGKDVSFSSPLDAIAAGIGMVHQSFKLFKSLTVWENIIFGSEPTSMGLIARQQARQRVLELARQHNLPIDPDATVGKLPIGMQQRVEILKALYRNADILILDEPTAVLSPSERDGLLATMRSLADSGKALVFVTHKLNEVMAVCDRVTVLRKGVVTERSLVKETTADEIVNAMTGREVSKHLDRPSPNLGDDALVVEGLTVGSGYKPLVDGLSLTVRSGEIVGVAGVAGNGQTELANAITGIGEMASGKIRIKGTDITALSVKKRRLTGLSFIPEDRHDVGSVWNMGADINVGMGSLEKAPQSRRGIVDRAALREKAKRLISAFSVAIAGPTTKVGKLSGGNLQKLIVARELDYGSLVLVVEQPTRGVDVGAIEYIHRVLLDERTNGKAILLISSELPEILALSDRILVMYEGKFVAELDPRRTDEREIGFYMAGAKGEGRSENAR
ncbi:ABC transporter ATP-binding protein [Rhizobium sp. SG741]|uniref:ABC transporter ATP-binding protein n=1 Tax=Rhizobium sp. SG741 TaxID=2587114 RepID=UPI001446FB70|nr:ABC transporter ATP-binding protein [Rhizobium sp. SG741]NKJ08385.1 simple sugar transport system ATP-binding protein [Rhizobium sp. SG741]